MPRGHVLPDGASIAALRGEAGLTQDELAERAGYGLRTIGNVEGGRPTTATTLTAIATVLGDRLGRPVHLADLLVRRRDHSHADAASSADVVFRENVKLLELPDPAAGLNRAAARARPPAVLTDTVCLRPVAARTAEILFYYPAQRSKGARCLMHAARPGWRRATLRCRERTMRRWIDFAALRLKLGATQRDTTVVQNRVEFGDGFSRPHRQAFQVHVAYPTESLTLLVKFPEGEPFRTLNGSWRRPGGPFVPGVEKPLGIASGSVAYWRVSAARPGETYQLSWT